MSIEEIINNPNLNLSKRIELYASKGIKSSEDLEEIALASIKQEYEFWIKKEQIYKILLINI